MQKMFYLLNTQIYGDKKMYLAAIAVLTDKLIIVDEVFHRHYLVLHKLSTVLMLEMWITSIAARGLTYAKRQAYSVSQLTEISVHAVLTLVSLWYRWGTHALFL